MRLEDDMNAAKARMLSLAMVLSGLACSAQDSIIPIRQMDKDARNLTLSATATLPENESAVGHAYGMVSGSSSSAGFVFVPPTPKAPRTISSGFLVLNGLHLGMAVFDVETTQHCIANHHCVEGNPLMPSSQAGQLTVALASVSSFTFISYRLKKRGNKMWRAAPIAGIAAHTVGVASGFEYR
jgi:hypothetical protein